MEDKMAYMFGEYLVEFVRDKYQIVGEVFFPGEKTPVGKVSCHYYNYSDPDDKSHIKDDSLHIDILRVQMDHDNNGIGTFLIKKVIEYGEKDKVKHITTTPSPTGRISMESLKKFYLKFRFSSGFFPKKIEFVDEELLLADVMDMSLTSDKSKNSDNAVTGDGSVVDDGNNATITTDMALTGSKASKVGYLTVVRFLDEALKSQNDILQIGTSGAEIYGLYLARKGHNVMVVEPDAMEASELQKKASDVQRMLVKNEQYDYLSRIPNESMDAVMCFGPMYSTLSMEEKEAIVRESYRVCKPNGTVFVSFVSNEMMAMDYLFNVDMDFLSGPKFDNVARKVVSPKMRLLTFEEIEVLFRMCDIKYNSRFAAEGIALLMRDKMENMNDKQFNQWMDFHYSICQKDELMGYSRHIVYVINKK